MYTSFSPVSDRFGFKLKSSFKGAYKNERTILIAVSIMIGVFVVLYGVSVFYFANLIDGSGAIKGGLVKVVNENGYYTTKPTEGFIAFSMFFLTTEAFITIMIFIVLGYIALLAILHAGRTYRFEANENGMTIYCPGNKTEAFLYKDITDIKYSERKLLLGSHGYDVVIITKKREYLYRLVHSHMSKVEGIAGTPFNIVLERYALANKGRIVEDSLIEEFEEAPPSFFDSYD